MGYYNNYGIHEYTYYPDVLRLNIANTPEEIESFESDYTGIMIILLHLEQIIITLITKIMLKHPSKSLHHHH